MNLLTAAKAALEVMAKGMSANYWSDIHPAMDNLRAAIEEAEKQEPVAWKYSFDGYYELLMPEEVEQDNFREHPEMYEALYLHPAPSIPEGWQPIETAPKDNKVPLFLARFNEDGTMQSFDYDGIWESDSESWEIPQVYWFWASANGSVEEPTHWMYQPKWFAKLPVKEKP